MKRPRLKGLPCWAGGTVTSAGLQGTHPLHLPLHEGGLDPISFVATFSSPSLLPAIMPITLAFISLPFMLSSSTRPPACLPNPEIPVTVPTMITHRRKMKKGPRIVLAHGIINASKQVVAQNRNLSKISVSKSMNCRCCYQHVMGSNMLAD